MSWSTFSNEAPELAGRIRSRFEAHLHHVLATLRSDGSPRVSGTEVRWYDGDVWLGSMPNSMKGRDLRRDGRYAIHSAPVDLELVDGDARISGTAEEVTDVAAIAAFLASLVHTDATGDTPDEASEVHETPTDAELFRLDVTDASIVTVAGDKLHVVSWRPGAGVSHIERS